MPLAYKPIFWSLMPNKSPEPTRIVAFSDSLEVLICHITGSGWLSFFR